jgi:rRNA maturation endonuclease Nob1
LILGLLLLAGTWGLIVDARLRRDASRRADLLPRCGRCGYIVYRLRGHVCPECGSNLMVVGVER